MNKTTIILSVLGVAIIGAGGWTYMNYVKYAPTTYIQETKAAKTVTTVNTTTGTVTSGAPSFTMAQVTIHSDRSSCYSVVNSAVYDLTMWVNMHPGGQSPILSMCGHDGTEAFMNQHHGGVKFMTVLARFKIGLFAQ